MNTTITTKHSLPNRPTRWNPVIGVAADTFIRNALPNATERERSVVSESAVSILGKSINPKELQPCQSVGLVVGQVQSGKTLSFTNVIALANDNGFRLIIVIAGTSNVLFEQSSNRLKKDLAIDSDYSQSKWNFSKNPSGARFKQIIENELSNLSTLGRLEDKKAVLITVLKNRGRINNLEKALVGLHLDNIPALVIDDEADQASLDTKAKKDDECSATYKAIVKLRERLPRHTFLQYTATPQAALLISISDSLSPSFVEVLNPGRGYVGGKSFFRERKKELIRAIPPKETFNENEGNEPPESLTVALRIFLLGVAVALGEEQRPSNLSMLIHPSHRTKAHRLYYSYINNIIKNWKKIILLKDNDEDKRELLLDFKTSYKDLKLTVSNLPPFEKLAQNLPDVLYKKTLIDVVNASSGKTPQINWNSMYAWILIGGQAMDRGFTVEGLTVTYMPRSIGEGNADTLQQRARFFGYKNNYIGLCRVYLGQELINAFTNYTEHEEDVIRQLRKIQENNASLSDWKREFILASNLKPCRDAVLKYRYDRFFYSSKWLHPKYAETASSVIDSNQRVIYAFLSKHQAKESFGHSLYEGIELRRTISELLLELSCSNIGDANLFGAALTFLSRRLDEEPDDFCDIYLMSKGAIRERSINENEKINQIFEGRNKNYHGDRELRNTDRITIQIHMLNFVNGAQVIESKAPLLAIWIPGKLKIESIYQFQPEQNAMLS